VSTDAGSHGATHDGVVLREVTDDDLPIFFAHQRDAEAAQMAQVRSRDRDEFDAHWARIRVDETGVIRTIVVDGEVAGNVLSFEHDGRREVGYWLGREFWGKGVATRALAAFLEVETRRPLHAAAAQHNPGSVRVLEKCGFAAAGEEESGLLLFVLEG
jgi:RimJ/RimL family protein N-acetyltransferase